MKVCRIVFGSESISFHYISLKVYQKLSLQQIKAAELQQVYNLGHKNIIIREKHIIN